LGIRIVFFELKILIQCSGAFRGSKYLKTHELRVGPDVIRAERSEQETPVPAVGIAGAHAGHREQRLHTVRSSTVGQAERWHAGVATAFSAYDTQPFLLVGTQALFNNDLFCCYGIVRVL